MLKRGLYTAIITPFLKDGTIDEKNFRKMIDAQINAGVTGIVPCGSTGESPTLTHEEHDRVIRIAVEQANDKCVIMAGTGSNSTVEAINLTEHARKAGADVSLQIVPYYNKPTQKGMYLHFKAVAEAVDIPIVIYNIKGRTGVNMETSTLVELSKIPNIVGVKESSGSIEQVMDVINATSEDFIVLSGDDNLTIPIMAAGGDGVVSVASNIIPERMVKFVDYGLNGDFASMRKEYKDLALLFNKLFIETNPIPVKTIMALLGRCDNVFRLPLCEASESTIVVMKELIKKYC